MRDLVLVGRVARPHGNKGHVIVNLDTDFPGDRFKAGETVLVGAAETPRVIRAVRFHQGRPIIALDGVDTMNDAEALAGAELKVPARSAGELPAGTFYHFDLIGCSVRDTADRIIGTVSRVEGTMEMSRLVVEGAKGEILIPLVADICVHIDIGAQQIVVNPPDGLVELNERGGAA
jgi:16S rRNA processing protein RimM